MYLVSNLLLTSYNLTMEKTISGLHHITAITGNAQKNIDFYTRVLGLKFTKLTVNFDDPTSYHLYFGDEVGSPGTALTFFDWHKGYPGRQGVDQATIISFAIPQNSLAFWVGRLTEFNIPYTKHKGDRFDDNSLSFKDPDGMQLELVAADKMENKKVFSGYKVPLEHAIRGFYSVTLWEDGFDKTDKFLRDVFGYKLKGESEGTYRYYNPSNDFASVLDVRSAPDFWKGELGTGIVHHVAFRTKDTKTQNAWREKLVKEGYDVTPIVDRQYFQSIYFREPGGVLFEIATEGPGFTVDESVGELGTSLKLPPQYEMHRKDLTKRLPELHLPTNE